MGDKLGEREQLMLDYIVRYRDQHHMMSPTVREVFAYLNTVLPKRTKGAKRLPALVSVEQVHRSAQKLKQLGLLLDLEKDTTFQKHMHRGLIPTPKGIEQAKK